ncbi:MAG: XkdQ/YqbQ family protein [Candidatus Merdivicinus sp.]|jgi:hypothetical protein
MKLILIHQQQSIQIPLSEFRLTTEIASAGILEWSTPCREILPENGDRVQLSDPEQDDNIFSGYIFRVEDNGRELRVLCYDQLKYLLYRDTRQFFQKTADQILWEIIREKQLTAGSIDSTGVTIPSWLCENQTLISMITGALEETFKLSGKRFLLLDRAGSLILKQPQALQTNLLLSGQNQLTEWSRASDIDGATYTQFKILQEDGRSGFRRISEAENAEQKQKWGALQYFERVDHSWNPAQVQARLQALQQSYRNARTSFSVSGIADFRCRAGYGIYCQLSGQNAIPCLIESSEITGKNGVFTMRLSLSEV